MKLTTTSVRRLSLPPFFLFVLLSAVGAVAQGLPNPGFEEWVESGKEPPFDWEEPAGWTSTNSLTEFISAGVRKSQNVHSGNYACSLSTLNIFGQNVPAAIVNGNPTIDFVNRTVDLMTGGTPFTGRPDNFSGYYRFSSTSEGDAGYAIVILKKYNVEREKADTVGVGIGRLEKSDIFTQFNIAIEYRNDEAPDSVVVAILSSDLEDPMAGGVLVVDDIVLQENGSGVADELTDRNALRLYPNPASGRLHLELDGREARERTVVFYDLLGREVLRSEFMGVRTTVDLPQSDGVYTCRVIGDGEGELVGRVIVEDGR